LDTTHRDRTAWQLKRERSLLANLGRGLDCSTWLYTHPITPPLSSHRHRCGTGELKLVIAHGGGYFPHNMGRLDRNVKNAPSAEHKKHYAQAQRVSQTLEQLDTHRFELIGADACCCGSPDRGEIGIEKAVAELPYGQPGVLAML
jgi:hypothetical protein